ncbi:BON domain-containing protein [Radicibacter daui]|uniref:BON domain-containing protein n=1 Tax=Radicibacter daui TaxID=3064829 RepID=UPI0040468E10
MVNTPKEPEKSRRRPAIAGNDAADTTRHSLELEHNREGIARLENGRPQKAEPTYEESARFGESWATRWTGDERTFDPRDQQARYALSLPPEGAADVRVAYARPVAAGEADERRPSDAGLDGYTVLEVRMLRQIEALFERELLLQGARIVVLLRAGDVRLAGRVPHEDARHRAEALARTVAGVRRVRNQLRIAIRTVPAP